MAIRGKLEFVQALRGLAALAVVLSHARYALSNTPSWDFAQRYFLWGAGGVDMFFIISGFIMVYTTRRFDGSAGYVRNFGIKRFAKIWPAYVLISIVFIFVSHDRSLFIAHLPAYIWRSFVFWPIDATMPMYFGSDRIALPVGWTLNFEAYFYLAFGISMLFKRFRWVALSSWMLFTLILIPAIFGVLTLDPMVPMGIRSAYIAMITSPLIWDFVIGMLAAALYLSPLTFPSARSAWIAFIAAVTVCIWGYAGNFAATDGLIGWGGYSALLFVALAMLSKVVELRVPRVLVALGDMSFTLYLVHETAFNLCFRILRADGHEDLTHTWSYAVLCIGSGIVLAAGVSNLLEVRLHQATLDFIVRLRRTKAQQARESTVPL